jgi:hypothetical protein
MGGTGKHGNPECYFAASAVSAAVNYPLWKASAMAQSGFEVKATSTFGRYMEAMAPPYRGMPAVITGELRSISPTCSGRWDEMK